MNENLKCVIDAFAARGIEITEEDAKKVLLNVYSNGVTFEVIKKQLETNTLIGLTILIGAITGRMLYKAVGKKLSIKAKTE